MMLKVALTGSIAVGKTFVTNTFAELGCCVLDADQTARKVVEKDTEGWRKIVESFGAEILNENGEIDRPKLGVLIFSDQNKRNLLNSIVHPLVFAWQNEWLQKVETENEQAIAIIDAALTIESGGYKRFDKIIVVWCEREAQILRLMKRNNLSREEAIIRISAQMSQEEKKKYANFLIETTNGFEDTKRQVFDVYQSLKILANGLT